MRNVLKSTAEVFHFWANRVQASGKSGSVSFEGQYLYSYAAVIARLLPDGVVLYTTRKYSVTTSGHVSAARSASRQYPQIGVYDPRGTIPENMRDFRNQVRDCLTAAERKGIRQTTRDNLKAEALYIATTANKYLEVTDGGGIDSPIDTSNLESVRAGLIAAEVAHEALRKQEEQARIKRKAETLEKWRTGEVLATSGLYDVPPALRLHTFGPARNLNGLELPDTGGRQVIQTSHGAEIPVEDAKKLWPVIQRVRRTHSNHNLMDMNLGNYHLRAINLDGSIVVGCHSIAYGEVERIAVALGLI